MLRISFCETDLSWMLQKTFDDKVNIVAGNIRQQAIAWTNVDPELCGYDVTSPQCVNDTGNIFNLDLFIYSAAENIIP